MFKEFKELLKKGGFLALVAIVIAICATVLSWMLTCLIIKLITVCFGVNFSWAFATGVWLALLLLKIFLKKH